MDEDGHAYYCTFRYADADNHPDLQLYGERIAYSDVHRRRRALVGHADADRYTHCYYDSHSHQHLHGHLHADPFGHRQPGLVEDGHTNVYGDAKRYPYAKRSG